jgi:ABC-type lipoprotein export system ATPase subunit
VIALFGRLNRDGTTIVVVTHDEELARAAGRVVHMRDGRIVDELRVPSSRFRVPEEGRSPETGNSELGTRN